MILDINNVLDYPGDSRFDRMAFLIKDNVAKIRQLLQIGQLIEAYQGDNTWSEEVMGFYVQTQDVLTNAVMEHFHVETRYEIGNILIQLDELDLADDTFFN